MRHLILLILLLTISGVFSQKVNYHLRMIQPQNHYFQVEMDVEDLKKTSFDVKLPVWAPGSYLVREFSKISTL